eukprot:110423-Pleurochrysis_carterae.AAC.1
MVLANSYSYRSVNGYVHVANVTLSFIPELLNQQQLNEFIAIVSNYELTLTLINADSVIVDPPIRLNDN